MLDHIFLITNPILDHIFLITNHMLDHIFFITNHILCKCYLYYIILCLCHTI